MLQAMEKREDVGRAMKDFHIKFAQDAEMLQGLGNSTCWHKRLGMWGHFSAWKRDDGSNRFWNAFGFSPTRLRGNIVVEINPPDRGTSKTMQGLLARSQDGARWVLHRGRMSIPGAHIQENQFDRISSSRRSSVIFADNSVVGCHLVADLDASARVMQNQVAAFVRECSRVRTHYTHGPEAAQQEASVEAAELSFPEQTGTYKVGGQGPKIVTRKHADVWVALAAALDTLKVGHSNGRVGRWGPDLRTLGKAKLLFEIKVTTVAGELQQAIGQLFLYEQLLQGGYQKILVLPDNLAGAVGTAVANLGVKVLSFSRLGRTTTFNLQDLTRLLK
ncbi:hypothetical protein [Acidisphaera sp. L21]|uniref:hypothetical protein n=1 Tax=Acidisphaera sp. L21 TaxID=1641851 RepID=UPI00131B7EFF|nr:hypothetical protein [Acidisphaera sp. L21]